MRETESDQQSFGGVVEEVAKEKADAPPTVPAQYDLTDHADDQRERLAKAEQQVATDAVLEKTPSEENAAKDFSSRPAAAAAVETLATRRAEANHNIDSKYEAEKKAVMVTSPKEDELLGLLRAAW